MAIPDRLEALRAQNAVTGIDFVYVFPSQTQLDVYFLNSPASLINAVAKEAVHIYSPSGGETTPVVPVTGVSWLNVGGREIMRLITAMPGDFSRYRLRIDDTRVDPYFNDVWFSFKANCESQLDCAPPPHECAPDPPVDFPIDYTARDFWSFRQALLDFAVQRYPQWRDRLEADVGIMLAEVMSALGDEFAYIQDRYARETYLETASQRRSLRRLAGLVDYQIPDGLAATTWLDFQMKAADNIAAGTKVTDAVGTIVFEVGRGLDESFPPEAPVTFAVAPILNSFTPHIWDTADLCLPAGATSIFIDGAHKADIPLDDTPPGQAPGKWMLLQTSPTDPAIKARAWMIRVVDVQDANDKLLNMTITQLTWDAAQATPHELDLTVLAVHANMLRATAGGTSGPVRFTVGPSSDPADRPSTIERIGSDNALAGLLKLPGVPEPPPETSVTHLFSLTGSDATPLAWLGDKREDGVPEVRLRETAFDLGLGQWKPVPNGTWEWRRALIGTVSAQPNDHVFTLDDGTWKRLVGYQRVGGEIVHRDYAANAGKTIRFGDGEFGMTPTDGTIFEAFFRLGNGATTNVAAGTLNVCAPATVASVTNPLAATGGQDAEPSDQVRQFAPEQFRQVTFRAVRPEDYAEAAERLPWVQRAGAAFRWTGSWMTAFVTPDPRDAFTMTADQRNAIEAQVDRFRQAGRPAYVLDPTYATLDLEIAVCVAPSSYQGEVEGAVLKALFGSSGIRAQPGFFSPDNFTFGTPLERSELEAAIQAIPGVRAVEEIQIRRRGWFDWRSFSELTFTVAPDEVIRVQNDPFLPERGAVKLDIRGGA